MVEIIAAVLKIISPIAEWIFKWANVSNELKQSFYGFVQKYSNSREEISSAKETCKKQEEELDAQLKVIDEEKK